jgi:hypothetical protein
MNGKKAEPFALLETPESSPKNQTRFLEIIKIYKFLGIIFINLLAD